MAIPIRYNFRNLRVRWRSTLATTLGIALVVAVFVMVMALARGLKATYITTGDENNLMILRKGSTAESSSQIGRDQVRQIKYLDGIARNAKGDPLASAEILVLINLDRIDRSGSANVLVRGMSDLGLQMRPQIRLTEGRWFKAGLHECVVSKKIADRFANCQIGDRFRAGKFFWTVVGIFDAHKTAFDSEIWVDADEARDAFNRDFYGSVLIRPIEDEPRVDAMVKRMEADKQLQVRILSETKYYKEQTKTAGPIQFMGSFLATIMSIGAAFSAMNTMYAAVGARTREIGTLRVLGFKRREIYFSFMFESIVLSLLGGLLGCLISLPLNGIATGTFSWTTFAEVAFEFRITPELLSKGLLFALVMGVLGGLLPARLAARKPVLDALRAV
jgi:putative ABC transport system permease protein